MVQRSVQKITPFASIRRLPLRKHHTVQHRLVTTLLTPIPTTHTTLTTILRSLLYLLTITSPPYSLSPSISQYHNLGLCQPWTICEYKDVDSGQSVHFWKEKKGSRFLFSQRRHCGKNKAAGPHANILESFTPNASGNRRNRLISRD